MGVLEWPPDQFWNAVPREITAALDGWQEKNGMRDNPKEQTGMTLKRLRELEERYPDG